MAIGEGRESSSLEKKYVERSSITIHQVKFKRQNTKKDDTSGEFNTQLEDKKCIENFGVENVAKRIPLKI